MKRHHKGIRQITKYFAISLSFTVFSTIILPCAGLHVRPTATPAESADNPPEYKISAPKSIQVYRSAAGMVENVPFEDYVKGVVAGEMPASFEAEALKAQAVTARTYAASKVVRGNPDAHPDAPLCDTTHCQVYRSVSELQGLKPKEWFKADWRAISSAVEKTSGKMLYYDGQLVSQALFFSSSGGRTENSEDVFVSAVPYLKSVDSPYETEATHQNDQTVISVSDFAAAVKKALPASKTGSVTASNIKILSRSEGGRVDKIKVGNATLTGRNIRDALNLNSANFTLRFDKNSLIITTSGFGHGVGMSQYGANGMAKKGYTYKEILTHYYSGTEIY